MLQFANIENLFKKRNNYMKLLYAPWRGIYTKDVSKNKSTKKSAEECVFCQQIKDDNDKENMILARNEGFYVAINKFPYNPGHLLIIPCQHTANLNDLSSETQHKIMDEISKCIEILKKEMNAEGINVGLNLGKVSGGSIPNHLHFHVLPRWEGDTNFLPVSTDTKPLSADLFSIYDKLKTAFEIL
ncbi:MAG: Histidine triad (HIT) protein [candidate division TM6 bacterium GW2011_GWF2_32_72]|nr:MAG: Histidine triad (HIT) protein [candidate division TM6 bacterium GW2011_GWF2_32_72]